MQKHHIHASKHTFREQKVNSNVAHLSPANSTVNRLNNLLSLIRVTAGVGVCPIPHPPPPTPEQQVQKGKKRKTGIKPENLWL